MLLGYRPLDDGQATDRQTHPRVHIFGLEEPAIERRQMVHERSSQPPAVYLQPAVPLFRCGHGPEQGQRSLVAGGFILCHDQRSHTDP